MTTDAGEEQQQRHIVVIGAGIVGASTAYYLSRPGTPDDVRITVLEEAPSCAPAASGKSGGFLAEDWHGPDTESLARLSYGLHRDLAKQDDGERLWCYREVETLSIAFDDQAKARSKGVNRHVDGIASWVDARYVSKASSMGGGGTTAQVTPLPLVEHLIEQAKSSGRVDVRYGTRAERVTMSEAGRVKTLDVASNGSAQSIQVDDVVVAAGPWTGSLLKRLLPPNVQQKPPRFLKSAMRITGSRAHSIVVQAPQPTTAHCLFTDMHYSPHGGSQAAGAPEVYCRGDGTVYACGGSDDVPLPASALEVTHDPKQTKNLVEQVRHLSPSHLATDKGASITRQQACYLPIASSSAIVAGDASSGLYVAAGHSCWGITLGLGTGKVMREMLYGERLSADISSLRG